MTPLPDLSVRVCVAFKYIGWLYRGDHSDSYTRKRDSMSVPNCEIEKESVSGMIDEREGTCKVGGNVEGGREPGTGALPPHGGHEQYP